MPRSGVKPRSRIISRASTNITTSIAARRTYGTPRLVSWAMKPPATEPSSMNTPLTTWPRENTASSIPSNLVAVSASTSQASVAPEKKVKPSPSSNDTIAHQTKGEPSCQSST